MHLDRGWHLLSPRRRGRGVGPQRPPTALQARSAASNGALWCHGPPTFRAAQRLHTWLESDYRGLVAPDSFVTSKTTFDVDWREAAVFPAAITRCGFAVLARH